MQHSPTAFVIIALLIVVKHGSGVTVYDGEDLIAEETRHKSVTIVEPPKSVEKPKEDPLATLSSTQIPDTRPQKQNGPPLDKHGKKVYVEIPRQYFRHVQKIPPHHAKLHHHSSNTVYKVIKVPTNSRNRIYSKPPPRLVFAASTGRPVIAKNPDNKHPPKNPDAIHHTKIPEHNHLASSPEHNYNSKTPENNRHPISIPVQTINGIPADVVRPPKFAVSTIAIPTITTTQPTTTTRLLRTKRIWPKRILERMNMTYPNFSEPIVSNTVNNEISSNISIRNTTDNEVSASRLKYVYTDRSPSPTTPATVSSTIRVYRRVTRNPTKRTSTPAPRQPSLPPYVPANYTKIPANDWVPIVPANFPKCPSSNKKFIIKKSHRRSDDFDDTVLEDSENEHNDIPEENPEDKPVEVPKNHTSRRRRSAVYQTLPNPLDEEGILPSNQQPLHLQPYDSYPAASNIVPHQEPISRKKTVFFRKRKRLHPLLYSNLRPVHVPPDYVVHDLQPEASHVRPKVLTKVKHHHHHHHHRYVQTIEKPVKVPYKVEVPKPYPVQVEKKVPVPYEKIKIVEKPVPYPVTVEKKVPVPVGMRVPYPVPFKVVEKEYIPKPYPVVQHVPIYKQVEVKVPHPVPVEVERKVPYPVRVQVPVPVEKRVPVPVTVEKKVPYPVPVKVLVPQPYPVETKVPVPYEVKQPVEVIKHVPVKVPVPQPYPVKIPTPIPVPYEKRVPYPVEVEKKVPYPVEVYVPQKVEVEKKVPVYIPKPFPVEKQVPYPVQVPFAVNVNGPYDGNVPMIVNNDLNDPYSVYKGLEDSLTPISSTTANSYGSSYGTSSTIMPHNSVSYHSNLGNYGFQSRSDKPEVSSIDVTTPFSISTTKETTTKA